MLGFLFLGGWGRLSPHLEPHQIAVFLWYFLGWEFSSHILLEGQPLEAPLLCYAVSQFGTQTRPRPLSSFGCSALSPELWSLYLDLLLTWAPSFHLLCLSLWFWRPSLILVPGDLSSFFYSLSVYGIFCLHFMYAFLCLMGGRGFFRISGLHVAGGNSTQIFIKVMPKQGSKMEIGSEGIICYAEVSFKSGLLLVCWN